MEQGNFAVLINGNTDPPREIPSVLPINILPSILIPILNNAITTACSLICSQQFASCSNSSRNRVRVEKGR